MAPYLPADNVLQAFLRTARAHPDDIAIRCSWDERLELVTWAAYERAAAQVAHQLLAQGLGVGERVLLSLPNCAAFHLADMGIVAAGGVPVSVYATASLEQTAHILRNSEARLVLLRPEHRRRFEEAALRAGRDIVFLEAGPSAAEPSLESWWSPGSPAIDLQAAAGDLTRSSVATVIYTSGTTGPAKGVVLSHGNVLSAFEATLHIVGNDGRGTRVVSYLPMAHVAERMSSHYNHVFYGSEVYTCPDPDDVFDVVHRVRPNIFFGPPRIWEKALLALAEDEREGDQLAAGLCRLGFGEVRVAVSGAAPMPSQLFERLRSAGLPISEVFGLSETTGVLTWDHADPRSGSVGRPLPGIEVRLAPDGEIQARGPVIFAGYSGDAAASTHAFTTDGWFRTGDLGDVDADNYLRIVGRAKELIVTAGGKNVAPLAIEGKLTTLPGVSQAMVVGDGRPFVGALVVMDPSPGAHETSGALLADAIAAVNASVSRAESVRRFVIVPGEWTTSDGLLTPTAKLRRSAIAARFQAEIDAMYAGRAGIDVPVG